MWNSQPNPATGDHMREHRRNLERRAAMQRLAKEARRGKRPAALHRAALLRLGKWLTASGQALEARYGELGVARSQPYRVPPPPSDPCARSYPS